MTLALVSTCAIISLYTYWDVYMARVTVEDCIDKVANRFKLVLMAAKRARDLERGAKPSVVRDNDKSTILALREIAEEAISLENLENLTRQNIISDEAELPYEDNELQLRSDDEIDDEDDEFDGEETETEEDDDWETSDNPYNRRIMTDDDDLESYEGNDDRSEDELDEDNETEDDYDEDETGISEFDDEEDEEFEDDLEDDFLDETNEEDEDDE